MRKLPNSVKEIPEIGKKFEFGTVKPPKLKDLQKKMQISFHFDLPEDKQIEFQQKIDSGQTLSIGELNNYFAPDIKEVTKLITWLKSNGFTKVRQSYDRLNVYAQSTAENISRLLECDVVVVDDNSKETVSIQGIPSIPEALSKQITSVNGLQPFLIRQKKNNKENVIRRYGNLTFKTLSTTVKGKPPYVVSDVLTAYNGLGMTYSGNGQTIGILIDAAPNNSDMTKFWQSNGLPNNLSRLKVINVRNTKLPAPSGEETLDTQWTSGIAKNAKINIYCSGDLYFSSLDLALDKIFLDCGTDPSLRQISVSLGLGENFLSAGELNTENTKYQRLRALGVNCFISSGDSGSNEGGLLQVSFPASNPNVVSVGGTKLILNNLASITSETAWSGSGGGMSVKYTKPTWQNAVAGTGRLVPDISALADPTTGAYVVLGGYVYQFGGTSLSAPVWAGICAIINEARVSAKKRAIGFLPPLIYNQIGSIRFRDITSGKNGAYTSSVGYDRVTGIGTPNIKNLISYFLSLS